MGSILLYKCTNKPPYSKFTIVTKRLKLWYDYYQNNYQNNINSSLLTI